ncbi:MAG TPA: LuxR C-terminal-related transcriptional regulator, partial [Euzebya sp.]|nr:LuxR C-terminal-related transcriptional regulator [Euzebya sp.]
ACGQVMAGQRVLAGGPLSVLASAGLEVSVGPATEAWDTDVAALLTPKESEVLGHLANHCSNAEIADAMHLSAATVKTHLSNIYAKLGVGGRREAVVEAVQQGLLS